MDDERAPCAEGRQYRGDGLHQLGSVDPDDLRPRSGRVGQWPEDVEDGARGQLATNGRRVPHGRMVRLGEQEAEAELVDRPLDLRGRQVEAETERLEHVGGPRRRGDRAVAVLGHAGARSGRHQRGRRGDVEGPRAVAPRSSGVDEILPPRSHREDVLAHRLRASRDLVGALPFQPQRDEEASHLRGGRLAAHDLVHHVARLAAREVAPLEQVGERLLDRHRLPSRKLRPSAGPSGVSTDSGWNWIPTTGRSR